MSLFYEFVLSSLPLLYLPLVTNIRSIGRSLPRTAEIDGSVFFRRLKLTPYQMIGINWLIMMHSHKLNGILGDEMVRRFHIYYFLASYWIAFFYNIYLEFLERMLYCGTGSRQDHSDDRLPGTPSIARKQRTPCHRVSFLNHWLDSNFHHPIALRQHL